MKKLHCKNVLHYLFYSWTQLCDVDKCKIIMLPSRETFHLRAYLKSLFKYFLKRWKIVTVKKYQLSFCLMCRYLWTSVFKMHIRFSFFWYIAWLVPQISNIFEKYPLISWSNIYIEEGFQNILERKLCNWFDEFDIRSVCYILRFFFICISVNFDNCNKMNPASVVGIYTTKFSHSLSLQKS